MEQQIRFCTTTDGVRIAYATMGEGPPLVRALGWFTHLEVESENRIWRDLNEAISSHHLLVRYDGRGMGLSDRDVTGFSLDAKVRDLEAVVDALKLRRFAILGGSEGGPTAIAYSVRHPDRVSRLILYGSFARTVPPETDEERQLLYATLMTVIPGWGKDTPQFRQLWTSRFLPEADAEHIRWFNEMQRVSATPETAAAIIGHLGGIDVRPLLADVRVPTLVVHRREDASVPFDRGRELAASIPGARFLPLEGRNHMLLPGEPAAQQFLRALEEFLAEDRKPAKRTTRKATAPSGLVTILFTDVEGYTTLTQRLGDAKARELLREHERMVREALKTHGGSEIKTMGDGFMASFGSATKALECAIAMQQVFAAHNESAEESIKVRVGLNAGEPIAEEEDLFGTAVNLAARICSRAEAGQILAPVVVRELAAGKQFMFADLGETELRGFEDPVRLYEVRWQEDE